MDCRGENGGFEVGADLESQHIYMNGPAASAREPESQVIRRETPVRRLKSLVIRCGA